MVGVVVVRVMTQFNVTKDIQQEGETAGDSHNRQITEIGS